jgi:hypothetical protein
MSNKTENKLVNEISYTDALNIVKKNLLVIFKKEEIENFNLPDSLNDFQKSLNDLTTKIKVVDFVNIESKVRLLSHIENFENGKVLGFVNQLEMYCYFLTELRYNEKRKEYQKKHNQNEQ